MLDFSGVEALTIPEGNVVRITSGETLIWEKSESFTKLTYISVPTTAWFNTGVVPSADVKWTYEARIYCNGWGSNEYYYFAVRQTKDYSTMYAPIHVNSGFKMYLNSGKTASAGGAKTTWYTVKSEIQDGLQNMWLDDTLKVTANQAISTKYTFPLYLFAANFNGSMYQGTQGRISWLKIHKGDELVCDFVAAQRNADGVCGLYDRVNKEFITNSGSGTITAGGVATAEST